MERKDLWTNKYNPLPRPVYKRKVEKWRYKWYWVKIDDIAKYAWDFFMEYKYQFYKEDINWNRKNIIIYPPILCQKYTKKSNIFDNRIQMSYNNFCNAIDTQIDISVIDIEKILPLN